MEKQQQSLAAEIINQHILTPIIYMVEEDFGVCFVCFCDGKMKLQQLYDTQMKLCELLGCHIEIADIRDFPVNERIELIQKAQIIYCENDFIRDLFETSVAEDFKYEMYRRTMLIDRQKNCESIYLN